MKRTHRIELTGRDLVEAIDAWLLLRGEAVPADATYRAQTHASMRQSYGPGEHDVGSKVVFEISWGD